MFTPKNIISFDLSVVACRPLLGRHQSRQSKPISSRPFQPTISHQLFMRPGAQYATCSISAHFPPILAYFWWPSLWYGRNSSTATIIGGKFPYLVWGCGASLHHVMETCVSLSYFGRCPHESCSRNTFRCNLRNSNSIHLAKSATQVIKHVFSFLRVQLL